VNGRFGARFFFWIRDEACLNKFPYEMIDPATVLDEAGKWEKIWSELFLKGQAIKKPND
jgi:hypothetical protein